jgi:hypothetical protein
MSLQRYSVITATGDPREIILLKAFPCVWGKCSFCDYIHDNSENEKDMVRINAGIISMVTGQFGVLEVINSGSCFEIPAESMLQLRQTVDKLQIGRLYFEAHWHYRHRLQEIRDYFARQIVFITGIETFDDDFRNRVLRKGIVFSAVDEIKKYFQSVCLMVGIVGQTKDMIRKDIDILLHNFEHGTINLFVDNTTEIKADKELQSWFKEEFFWLKNEKKIDILFNNTDFGVGDKKHDK